MAHRHRRVASEQQLCRGRPTRTVANPGAVPPRATNSPTPAATCALSAEDVSPGVPLPRLLALYQRGRFPFDGLVTRYPFDGIEEAAADVSPGR
ncbi:hypothetical protein ACFYRY_05110 [Streptomyces sp. NPDC005263]|uniref:hypothetical protein n=1 Tax=Streptomyces sp. NPDC005263 TaxID=3364711 RepID=UPI0036A06D36